MEEGEEEGEGRKKRKVGEEDDEEEDVVEGLGRRLEVEEEKDFSETPFPHFTFSLIEKTGGINTHIHIRPHTPAHTCTHQNNMHNSYSLYR